MYQRESIAYAAPTGTRILPTMHRMETGTETPSSAIGFLDPLSGWEAAARWNRATFDWMAKGWQQWLALVTTVPPHFLVPPAKVQAREAPAVRVRAPDAAARAVAQAEPKRAARARVRTPTAKGRNSKARTRG